MGNSTNPNLTKQGNAGDMSIPKSPEKEDSAQLGFKKQPMVDWFSPSQLAQTGLRAIISAMFGSYSDNRELQAALTLGQESKDIFDYSEREEVWMDYVSDMGSGWNSTYSVAYLLGRKFLNVSDSQKKDYELPRGNILVMGGDEVYPTPSWKEYNNRFLGPYRCSLPYVEEAEKGPSLFAIPGNHDWYDGLASFLKLFCQNRWIGGWRTQQSRSYFAINLPHNWWLWGIDIQLSADIDKPQLNYFDEVYRRAEDGDTVILCTAEPVWVYQEYQKNDKSFKNLNFFEKRYSSCGDKKLNFKLMLTGDMHHYISFRKENTDDPKWKITAGGGGAFLHPTHQVPNQLHLNDTTYQKSAAFPDAETSRTLAWHNLKFPFINKKFGAFFAVIYLFFSWFIGTNNFSAAGFFLLRVSRYSIAECGKILQLYAKLITASPGLCIFLLLIFGGILSFTDRNRKKTVGPWALGVLHGLSQVFLLLFAVWLSARLVLHGLSLTHLSFTAVITFSVLTAMFGWLLSGFTMGLYLMVAILLLKTHETEAFSSFRNEDFKNFLRLHISDRGIEIYPIKVTKSMKHWVFKAGVEGEESWYVPKKTLKYELIEDPIVIKKS